MESYERQQLEQAQAALRVALKALPDKKDDRLTLVREFIGAEEEGLALDVLLILGEVQKAPGDFWEAVTEAGTCLGASGDSPWLTSEAQDIWKRQTGLA